MKYGRIDDESPLTLDVLKDPASVQWQWLTRTYRELRRETEQRGSRFAIIFFPLAYQLDEDYPLLPQEDLMQFCREENLPCLDLLPLFRKHAQEELFMDEHDYHHNDIWHLTPRGHEVTATGIRAFLQERGLLPAKEEKAS